MSTDTLTAGAAYGAEDNPRDFVRRGSIGSNAHPFAALPFASAWVFLSGKEMLGRTRLFEPGNLHYLVASLVWLAAGVAGMVWALSGISMLAAVPVYFVSMILIVGGARYMVATNIHMMAHHLMFRSAAANLWWGEILSTIFLIQSLTRYRSDHLKHHGKIFATLDDGDAVMVLRMGFVPGKTPRQLWLNLLKLCASPRFNLLFLKGRLRENLVLPPTYRKAMTLGWFAIVAAIGWFAGPAILFHAYLLPILLLIQPPAVVQLLCEHVYINTDMPSRERHKLLSNGRYCGVPLPPRSGDPVRHAAALTAWSLRMIFVELPFRIIVLQGSMPEHDWHHRHPGSRIWANGRMLREEEVARELAGKGETSFLETWGSFEIVDRVLRSMSRATPYPQDQLMLSGALDYGDIK